MSATPEHISMLYTMPEHRITHLAQSLFPKMQPIIKDSTRIKLYTFRMELSDMVDFKQVRGSNITNSLNPSYITKIRIQTPNTCSKKNKLYFC
jgi:hypothetical protein